MSTARARFRVVMPRTRNLLRVAAALAMVVAAAIGASGAALPAAAAPSAAAPNSRAPRPGSPPPGFALEDAGGVVVKLAKLKGEVVWVDFWASWCAPCRESFPWLNAMQQKYGAKGFKVVGINIDGQRRDAARFLEQVPARFTIVFDAAGATPEAWGIDVLPSSVLIDRSGKVAVVEHGFSAARRGAFEARIRALVER